MIQSASRVRVMGILNVTPDSFSDGGLHFTLSRAIDRAAQMISEGADILDIGGESTRPGATPVSVTEEIDRVIPVIQAIKQRFAVSISVDTSKPEVMQQALALGVDMVNDITALAAPGALNLLAENNKASVCLMHMQGQPQTMQEAPVYDDVVAEVRAFLQSRIERCLEVGITRERIMIDPGIGFGKTLAHNLALLRNLRNFTQLSCTVLVGFSRKRMLKELLGHDASVAPEARLFGGLALASWCAMHGAGVIRTHDVAATSDVLKVMQALV